MTYPNKVNMRMQLAIAIVLLSQEAENLGDHAVYLHQSAEILTYIVSNELEHTDWREMLKEVIPTDAYEEVEKIVFFEAVDYVKRMWSKTPQPRHWSEEESDCEQPY